MQIPFVKLSFGHLRAGSAVQVDMSGVESDVYLTDSTNLGRLERGDLTGFRHYGGGHYTQSPAMIPVPFAGQWHAVVIPIGGSVRASGKALSIAA